MLIRVDYNTDSHTACARLYAPEITTVIFSISYGKYQLATAVYIIWSIYMEGQVWILQSVSVPGGQSSHYYSDLEIGHKAYVWDAFMNYILCASGQNLFKIYHIYKIMLCVKEKGDLAVQRIYRYATRKTLSKTNK